MCIVIDTNMASLIFGKPKDADSIPVINWLTDPQKNGCLVFGGKLSKELDRVNNAKRFLKALNAKGRAIMVPKETVDAEEQVVLNKGYCRSDDPHVIALARLSGARTLCSKDNNLHCDFKNLHLISKPKGKIYQDASHSHLLCHTSSCPIKHLLIH